MRSIATPDVTAESLQRASAAAGPSTLSGVAEGKESEAFAEEGEEGETASQAAGSAADASAAAATTAAAPMSAAEQLAATRKGARERARARAAERRQRRKEAGGRAANVGSFWATSTGQRFSEGLASGSPTPSRPKQRRRPGSRQRQQQQQAQEEEEEETEVSYAVAAESKEKESKEGDGKGDDGDEDEEEEEGVSAAAGHGLRAVRALGSSQRLLETQEDTWDSLADVDGGVREAFEVLPAAARLGELRVGGVYRLTMRLHNTTAVAARYRMDPKGLRHTASGNSVAIIVGEVRTNVWELVEVCGGGSLVVACRVALLHLAWQTWWTLRSSAASLVP